MAQFVSVCPSAVGAAIPHSAFDGQFDIFSHRLTLEVVESAVCFAAGSTLRTLSPLFVFVRSTAQGRRRGEGELTEHRPKGVWNEYYFNNQQIPKYIYYQYK